MAIKNVKKKVKIRKGKTKGMGFLSWERLEKRLRQINELTEQDELVSIYTNDEGLHYTTRKKRGT